MVELSINAAAEVEYELAFAWYLERSDHAAAGFEAAMDRAMDRIATFPEACPLCDERHRYCSLRKYPYGVIYRFDGMRVRVVAITHDKQLPGFWIDRI